MIYEVPLCSAQAIPFPAPQDKLDFPFLQTRVYVDVDSSVNSVAIDFIIGKWAIVHWAWT